MTLSLYPPVRPRTLAELLDASLKIFRISLPKCLPYASIAILFGQLSTLYDLARGHVPTMMPTPLELNDPVWVGLYLLGYLLFFTLWMAMLLRQAAIAAGRPPGERDLLEALKQTPAVVAIVLIGDVLMLTLISPPLTLIQPYRQVGLAVMVLVAFYVLVSLSLALPTRMLTRKGVLQSLLYSLQITRSNWWRAAALYAISASIIVTVWLLTAVITAMILPGAGRSDAVARAIMSAVVLAVGAMGLIFFTATQLTLFGDLQLRQTARGG